jgi:hypothetical protein
LCLSLWLSVCGLIPTRANFLERFNFESLVYPRLGVVSLKHYLKCPCRRIAWSSSPWLTRFDYLFISLIEVLSACRLWIWTTVVEVLVIFFAIRKSVVIGPGVVLFNVVVDCVVLYILCVGLYVVYWDFLCLYYGFLPSFYVHFSVIVVLVVGRISFILYL